MVTIFNQSFVQYCSNLDSPVNTFISAQNSACGVMTTASASPNSTATSLPPLTVIQDMPLPTTKPSGVIRGNGTTFVPSNSAISKVAYLYILMLIALI